MSEQPGERAYESAEKLTDAISTLWASGKDDGKHINLRRVLQEQCKAIDKRLAELESQVATLTAALEEEKTTLQESEQCREELHARLREIALIVKGPEGPMQMHGFSDLPKLVLALKMQP